MAVSSARSFRGRFEMRMDSKGRLTMPASYMQSVAEPKFVVTNFRFQAHACLQVFHIERWLAIESQIDSLPALEPAVQAFNRFFLSAGQEVELDAQNRLMIPLALRKFAGLTEAAVLIGLGDKFEIWDSSNWHKVFSALTENFEQIQISVSAQLRGQP